MERAPQRSPSHQINTGALEFASTRSGQHEPPTSVFFDERVDNVEQGGGFLKLVKEYGGAIGLLVDQLSQALGAGDESPKGIGLQQIEAERFAELMLYPCRLSSAPRPEKKKTAFWVVEKSWSNSHFATQYGKCDLDTRCTVSGKAI